MDPFWLPVGSLWLPLAPFWLPVGSLWFPLVPLWLPVGSLRIPLAPFWILVGSLLAPFGYPLAPFWIPVGYLLAPFGVFLVPFGSLLDPSWFPFDYPLGAPSAQVYIYIYMACVAVSLWILRNCILVTSQNVPNMSTSAKQCLNIYVQKVPTSDKKSQNIQKVSNSDTQNQKVTKSCKFAESQAKPPHMLSTCVLPGSRVGSLAPLWLPFGCFLAPFGSL